VLIALAFTKYSSDVLGLGTPRKLKTPIFRMPTVGSLRTRITSITDELAIIISGISTQAKDLSMQKEIREFKEEADTYDTQFVEEESRLSPFGKKSRKQSLQEFVLLIFYVAIALLTCALVLYSFTNVSGASAANAVGAGQIFAVMCFATLVITAIIVKYA